MGKNDDRRLNPNYGRRYTDKKTKLSKKKIAAILGIVLVVGVAGRAAWANDFEALKAAIDFASDKLAYLQDRCQGLSKNEKFILGGVAICGVIYMTGTIINKFLCGRTSNNDVCKIVRNKLDREKKHFISRQ